jgi:esterase/lipase superfamily enzyme
MIHPPASRSAGKAIQLALMGLAVLMLAACSSAREQFSNGLSPSASTAPTTGDIMPVFVATSRKMGADGSVTAELSSTTNYLMNVISIPKDHQTGMIERPSWGSESRKSHFVFVGQRVLDHDGFRNEIATQLSGRVGASRDVLVYVHGFNTGYDEARFRIAQIATDSGFTGVPVLFTWPSQNKILAYGADKENATASRDDLHQVLTDLGTIPGIGRIHVLAHSMGTWLTMEALREAALSGQGDLSGHLGEVMLAAPDIDLEVFKQQLGRVGAYARVSIFAAADDKALSISSTLAGDRKRVGALDPSDKDQRAEITKLGVRVYDLSNTDTSDFFRHGTFAEAPAAVRAIGAQLSAPPDDARQAQSFQGQ